MKNVKEMIRNKVNSGRVIAGTVALSTPLVLGTMTSYAADSGAAGALTSACTAIASDVSSAISGVLPIALPLVGAALVVTIGLNVFKRITNKA